MASKPDQDEFLDDDERDEMAQRSIFAAGWFRALLVLTVLAIVVVVSLPYLLNWLEPTPAPQPKPQVKSSEPAPGPAPAPPATGQAPPGLMPGPSGGAPPAKSEATAPPTTAQGDAAKPAPAAPSPTDRPLGTAPLPAVPPAVTAKPGAAKAAPGKTAAAPRRAPAGEPVAGGTYWVQVGAFTDEKNAEALARTLRAEKFSVEIARVARSTGAAAPRTAPTVGPAPTAGQNQLFITGSTGDAINAALKGKGTAQPVKGGFVVNPSFDLETAMTLSSTLKKEGFKVVIRRARTTAPVAPSGGGGTTFHVVRVGSFPDKERAQQARADLRARGHTGFLTQGGAR